MAVDFQAQSRYDQFTDFATKAAKEKTIVATEHFGMHVVPKSKFDFIGNIGRSAASKAANDTVRSNFMDSVLGMFGVRDANDLPDSVKAAMKLDDYGKGKPLTARRVLAVKTAVDEVLAAKAQPLMAAAAKEDIPLNDTMKKLIFAAVGACIDDQDVLDLVTECISGVLRYEHKTLSSFEVLHKIESVKGRVRAMAAYVDELRQGAGNNPEVYAEGLRFLGRQNGKVMQPGVCRFLAECLGELHHAAAGNPKVYAEGLRFLQEDNFWSLEPGAVQRMVASVMDLDVKDVGLLTPTASARDIQKAAGSFSSLLDKAMRSSGVDQITTPHLMENCRRFLANMIFAKALGDGVSVKDVQSALETGTASKLKRLYADSATALRSEKDGAVVYFDTRDLDGATVKVASGSDKLRLGQRQRMADEVDAQLKLLDQLKEAVDLCCGGEQRPIVPYGKPLVQAEVDPEFEAMGFIADKAFGKMESDQKAFISGSVKGKGRCADEMRFIFERKIMDVQPYKTGEAIQERCQATIKGMLRKSVADGCKMFAHARPDRRVCGQRFKEELPVSYGGGEEQGVHRHGAPVPRNRAGGVRRPRTRARRVVLTPQAHAGQGPACVCRHRRCQVGQQARLDRTREGRTEDYLPGTQGHPSAADPSRAGESPSSPDRRENDAFAAAYGGWRPPDKRRGERQRA